MAGEAAEQVASARGDAHGHAPAVACAGHALDQPLAGEAVDQLDRGIVAQEEPLGQQPDVRHGPGRASGKHQKHLVLLGSQSRGAGGAAAEIQEAADAKAEFFNGAERARRIILVWHETIISYSDISASRRYER